MRCIENVKPSKTFQLDTWTQCVTQYRDTDIYTESLSVSTVYTIHGTYTHLHTLYS